ncbi:MAG: hypothetical protein IJK42_12125 [Prevotella sp.]|nr:hypothetical protein [Prevotella sp.]
MELLKKKKAIIRFMIAVSPLLGICSCSFGKFMKSISDIKYLDESHFQQNWIRTDGVFIAESTEDCLIDIVFLFGDGGFMASTSSCLVQGDSGQTVINWDKLHSLHGYNKKKSRWDWDFGVYKIHGDTIEASQYEPYYFLVRPLYFYWWMNKYQFYIVNDETVELFFSAEMLGNKDLYDKALQWGVLEKPIRFHYVKADSLPSSSMKYKKSKWMWHSKEAWKDYMKKNDH